MNKNTNRDIKVGQQYFFIYFNPSKNLPGGQFNLDNFDVVQGTVKQIRDTVLMETKDFGLIELSDANLFDEHDEAEQYRLHLSFLM